MSGPAVLVADCSPFLILLPPIEIIPYVCFGPALTFGMPAVVDDTGFMFVQLLSVLLPLPVLEISASVTVGMVWA